MNTEKRIKNYLNKIEEITNETDIMLNDCLTFRKAQENMEKADEYIAKVKELMAERGDDTNISSQYGDFIAYKQVIGRSGVNTKKLWETGLMMWFIMNHPECVTLDLRAAEKVLGQSLSAYAKRDAYCQYNVSTSDDYQYIQEVIEKYRQEREAEHEAVGH